MENESAGSIDGRNYTCGSYRDHGAPRALQKMPKRLQAPLKKSHDYYWMHSRVPRAAHGTPEGSPGRAEEHIKHPSGLGFQNGTLGCPWTSNTSQRSPGGRPMGRQDYLKTALGVLRDSILGLTPIDLSWRRVGEELARS